MDIYACWLSQVRGLGKATILALREEWMTRTGREGRDFAEDIRKMPESELQELCACTFGKDAGGGEKAEMAAGRIAAADEKDGKSGKVYAMLRSARQEKEGEAAALAEAADVRFLSFDDPEFPDRLRSIPRPPYGLYVRGRVPDSSRPTCAVIGARMASAYGREQARAFGKALADAGIPTVSGMARGVDGIAQRAATEAGGCSYAVLGCGADICYPQENADLYIDLLRHGGILSEYPPGTKAEARLFPDRNRIISGLSDTVLVIEARERSGTLITVDAALEQGREIAAVPGRVSDALSCGCNRLIRQGAAIATCPDDVIEMLLGVHRRSQGEDRTYTRGELAAADLQEPERTLYEITGEKDLCDTQYLLDRFEEKRGHTLRGADILRFMTMLTVKGLVGEAGTGIYGRIL